MIRFSFSFQQETPLSLQTKATELLLKVQEVSRPSGSVKDFLTPSRQVISSSMEKDKAKRESSREREMRVFFFIS
jgi:hypothetical protein